MDDKWRNRFLKLADTVAVWSKDPSTKVGAVIVRPDRTIVSLGYNGFPRGVADDKERYDDRALKYNLVVHAEANAILSSREPLQGYSLITTLPPCAECTKLIIQSGVVYIASYAPPADVHQRYKASYDASQMMLREANVFWEWVQR